VNNNTNYIKVNNLSITYINNGSILEVTNNLSFSIGFTKRLAILGPSGCGKSSILKVLAGIINPTKGEIFYGNFTIPEAKENKLIGMVPQNPGLMPWKPTFENIALPLRIEKASKQEINYKVEALLKLMDLMDFIDFFPHQLSGGMQSRVAIARAIVNSPQFLLLDECFGALDELTREKLNIELSPIFHKLNTTIIFITHSIQEAIFLADEILILSRLPVQIKRIVKVNAEQPRDECFLNTNLYHELSKEIRFILKNEI
jgi:NitT/TauT family transport system ATP-binding protein